ncbi:MAG: transposase [Candidatus Yonathbacteria bacterium]|nr:transposase [Candidatus Yonathbacteria bacterium]
MTVQSIGIDVSKRTLDVALYSTEKEFTSYVFENTPEGIILLGKTLATQGTAPAIHCVVESTGMYHLPVSLMLKERGRRVNCIRFYNN